jgi:hypothetical protein
MVSVTITVLTIMVLLVLLSVIFFNFFTPTGKPIVFSESDDSVNNALARGSISDLNPIFWLTFGAQNEPFWVII